MRKRIEEVVDGEYQNYKAKGGAYTREHFFGHYPELKAMVAHLSDDEIYYQLVRGGHDPVKVYNAYDAATTSDRPTVILAKTVKGYGLGTAGEAQNIAHQQKKLDEAERLAASLDVGRPMAPSQPPERVVVAGVRHSGGRTTSHR